MDIHCLVGPNFWLIPIKHTLFHIYSALQLIFSLECILDCDVYFLYASITRNLYDQPVYRWGEEYAPIQPTAYQERVHYRPLRSQRNDNHAEIRTRRIVLFECLLFYRQPARFTFN